MLIRKLLRVILYTRYTRDIVPVYYHFETQKNDIRKKEFTLRINIVLFNNITNVCFYFKIRNFIIYIEYIK